MTLTAPSYANSIAHSTFSSASSNSSFKMTVKPCVAKGHRECVQGFLRDRCCKCTKGSVTCGMCPSSPSSSSCIFCVDGRKECDDCYGAGFIQRICRDCIKEHYRRQSNPKNLFSLTKVTEQSKSVVSNLSESILQATVSRTRSVLQQSIQKHSRSGSSVSLPESVASEHSTASAPSTSRTGSSKSGPFQKRLSLDHERSSASSSPATASSFSAPSSPNKHRRKWSWSSILTAA
ncbi:hypothetical protein EC991_009435 [Linnemannia zychae]|nr:hypothetical protein EC991_009435 [Linnemannia zychae]